MKKISLASALGAVFAIVVVLSVFLNWIDTTTLIFGIEGNITGWEIFSEEGISNNFDYYLLPIVILAMAVLSVLIFLFAPKGNVTVLVTVVLGIAIVALAYFTFYQFDQMIQDMLLPLIEVKMAFGLYITMIAGALTAVCGALARE